MKKFLPFIIVGVAMFNTGCEKVSFQPIETDGTTHLTSSTSLEVNETKLNSPVLLLSSEKPTFDDGKTRIETFSTAVGIYKFTYDIDGNLKKYDYYSPKTSNTPKSTFEYKQIGKNLVNDGTRTFEINDAKQIVSMHWSNSPVSYKYSYDANGNIVKIKTYEKGELSQVVSYTYAVKNNTFSNAIGKNAFIFALKFL